MHKRSSRSPEPAAPGARRSPTQRTDRREADAERVGAASPARGARAHAKRLAAELETLKAELDAARAQVRALEARADVDPLTDILNRRGFERELERSIAYVRRYGTSAALIYLDLDDFKPINDRHGHSAGDAMLKAVAATLRRQVRASDVIARVGGDEFAVLLWNISARDATAKAEALERAVVQTRIRHGKAALSVGASAGVTALEGGDAPNAAVNRADLAMYARKARVSPATADSAEGPTIVPPITR